MSYIYELGFHSGDNGEPRMGEPPMVKYMIQKELSGARVE